MIRNYGNRQRELDFESVEEGKSEALPPHIESPDDWMNENPLHLNRTTFKGERFYGPGEKERLKKNLGRRKGKTDAAQDETHELIADLMHPAPVSEQAAAIMEEMRKVEELRKTESMISLYPNLTSIRTALSRLGVLDPSDANLHQVLWNAPINNDRSGTTYADQFAGTFHYYLEEILPMLSSGVVKSGNEALQIHSQYLHETLTEGIRRLEALKKARAGK